MPFSVRNRVDAANMVTNWSAGVGRSGAKWATGALNPRKMFNADPSKAATNWQAGVAQAQSKYENNLKNTDLVQMENNIKGAGQTRYQQSGTQKAGNFQKVSSKLASLIEAAMAHVANMDTSTPAARMQKSLAFQQYMNEHKNQVSG